MRYLSGVGLALSLIFGCLLLALVAELYYLLWWKKRITNREIEDDYSSPAKEFLYMFCCKKPSSLRSAALNPQDTHVHEPQALLHAHSNKDLWAKTYGEQDDGVEDELMRLQNLSGPPRFLFTIKEETKEDLESEDGKSRGDRSRQGSRGRSLSDLLLTVETPFLTPLASPPYFTPPLTPMDSSHNHQHGFSPLFESSTDAEFNRIRASPPPKFKFLKDAEDKLLRRRQMEEDEESHKIDGSTQEGAKAPSTSVFLKDEENGSFITLIVDKNRGGKLCHPHHNIAQYHSSSSQVLPLASSPSTFTPQINKKAISH